MGGQRAEQLYPENLLPSGIAVVIATDDGSAGKKGLVTALLPDYIDWADQVFACGPIGMYQNLAKRKPVLLKGKPTQLSLDSRMACGHGVCYGCTIETAGGLKQICNDGPVFEMSEIENILLDDSAGAGWLQI
jgi:dihydroorotate dehydrogenase electron transfer subunit